MDTYENGNNPMSKTGRPTAVRSIGWLFLFLLAFYGSGLFVSGAYSIYLGLAQPELAADEQALEAAVQVFIFSSNGFFWVFVAQVLLLFPLVIVASHFKEQPWWETLTVKPISLPALGFWLLVVFVYLVATGIITTFIEVKPGEVMEPIAGSRHIGLFFMIVLPMPILEELVFRGYLYRAWRRTWLGAWGTILFSSLLFTLLHGHQYPGVILGLLFVFAVFMGVARERTGSVVTPMVMHVANNAVAAVSIVFVGNM